MRVREIMTAPAITVRDDCPLESAARMMFERRVGCLLVVDDDEQVCGIVTASDFCAKEKAIPFSVARFPQVLGEWMPDEGVERVYQAARRAIVRDVMSHDVAALTEDDTIETALTRMLQTGFHRLPVVRGRKPVGVVSRNDLLRIMLARRT